MLSFTAYLSVCFCFVVAKEVLSSTDDLEHYRELYKEFKNTYRKNDQNNNADDSYRTNELSDNSDDYRFKIFVTNMKRAEQLQKEELGTAEYGITQFSDLTDDEFKNQYLGLNQELALKSSLVQPAKIPDIRVPTAFDWRDKKGVSPVKDQRKCGCCWAFTAVANIESLYAIKYHKFVSLSEQELVDCDHYSNGCVGGWMANSFDTLLSRGGLVLDSIYPYEEINTTCRLDKVSYKFNIKGYVDLGHDEDDMAKYIYQYSPICVGINSTPMKSYRKGIIYRTEANCDNAYLDHTVLLIGFGIEDNTPYWIAKNSWSPYFGEKGFLRIYRGEGVCGINRRVIAAYL